MSSVAIVGVNGLLAKPVISALTNSPFSSHFHHPIRAITRDVSNIKEKLPGADYVQGNDQASYQKALSGVDTVIDLRGRAILSDNTVIESAAAAGVKLYITSEYGPDYVKAGKYAPVFESKHSSSSFARSQGFKVVELKTGYFIETVAYHVPELLFLDLREAVSDAPEVKIHISMTSLRDVGLSIASIASKNPPDVPEVVRVSGQDATLDDIIAVYEKVSGRNVVRKAKSIAELTELADNALAAPSAANVLDIIRTVSVITDAGDFSAKNDNQFVNPGLFEWQSLEQRTKNIWK
jgi:hypothetical protein